MQNLRDKLVAVLEASDVNFDCELKEETPLIRSGRLDSLGLFNLALFIESQIGREVDITTFEIAKEWNTIPDILRFIGKHRA